MIDRRWFLAMAGLLPLAACVEERPRSQPTFYADLARPGSSLDLRTANEIINAYRQGKGLALLAHDPALSEIAAREAERLATRGELDDGENATLASTLAAAGFPPRQIRKSISGGYHTFADAFSGWRGAPHHDGVLREARGKRYGLAARYRAGSRHRVYWVMLVSTG